MVSNLCLVQNPKKNDRVKVPALELLTLCLVQHSKYTTRPNNRALGSGHCVSFYSQKHTTRGFSAGLLVMTIPVRRQGASSTQL